MDDEMIKRDLKDTMTFPFATIIKNLIIMKAVREDGNKIKPDETEKMDEYGEEQFHILLTEAIAFCNNEGGRDSSGMKRHLGNALKLREKAKRYPHLVASFNSVLVPYFCKAIGTLEHPPLADDFLFVVNDALHIKYGPLSDENSDPYYKPGICDLRIDDLHWLAGDECQDYNYQDWANFVAMEAGKSGELPHGQEDNFRDLQRKASVAGRNVGWRHISTCIEVQASITKDVEEVMKKKKYTLNDMLSIVQKPGAPASIPENPSGLGGSSPGEGQRASGCSPDYSSSHDSQSTSGDGTTMYKSGVRDIEIQCGYYAVELLKSFPDRTHAIVLLLSDDKLILRCHDAQGCVATEPLDVVAHLPYLVAMLILFQRFGPRMRGRAHFEFEAIINGKKVKFEMPMDAHIKTATRGRRTTTCVPVPKGFADVGGRR